MLSVPRETCAWTGSGRSSSRTRFAIEERFGVRFRGNELAEFANVGELKRFLEEHANGSAQA